MEKTLQEKHEEELALEQFLGTIEDPLGDGLTEELADKAFAEIAGCSAFKEYLRLTLNEDLKRHFRATEEEQKHIHGAFSRTAYLRGKLLKAERNLTNTN